ncbi:hypothetical protein MTO96_043648 [Rhipicephalus appendiculatus]
MADMGSGERQLGPAPPAEGDNGRQAASNSWDPGTVPDPSIVGGCWVYPGPSLLPPSPRCHPPQVAYRHHRQGGYDRGGELLRGLVFATSGPEKGNRLGSAVGGGRGAP